VAEDAARVLRSGASLVHHPSTDIGDGDGEDDYGITPLQRTEIAASFRQAVPPLPPNTKRLYLLRHGRTSYNVRGLVQGGGYDIPLNEEGLRQAQLASAALSSIPMDVIGSSHLDRAIGTAEILRKAAVNAHPSSSQHTAAKRAVLPGLGEMRFGTYEGIAIQGPESTPETQAGFRSMNEKIEADDALSWPGPEGECTRDVRSRTRKAVEDVMERHSEARHVALVGHGRSNKILMSELLGSVRKVFQGNTAINVLDYDVEEGCWKEVVVNYTHHVDEHPSS